MIACNGLVEKLTAAQFKKLVKTDPAWASKLTGPVEITTYCNMTGSGITHLSPFLTFRGQILDGTAASFAGCKDLQVAEGCFDGCVNFSGSGIRKIGNLVIFQPGFHGIAANFFRCLSLTEARGTYPGAAIFAESGISRIGDLTITLPLGNGVAAQFDGCEHLRVAEGSFPGSVDFSNSGVERIGDLKITCSDNDGLAVLFEHCANLKTARGSYSGFASFDGSPVSRIEDFVVFRSAGNDCAIPDASFIDCPISWKDIKHACLLEIMKKRYHGIWEQAVDEMVSREISRNVAREALRDPGIEL